MQPGELDPGNWFRRLLCILSLHQPVGKVRYHRPGHAGIVMYCCRCWKRLDA